MKSLREHIKRRKQPNKVVVKKTREYIPGTGSVVFSDV